MQIRNELVISVISGHDNFIHKLRGGLLVRNELWFHDYGIIIVTYQISILQYVSGNGV